MAHCLRDANGGEYFASSYTQLTGLNVGLTGLNCYFGSAGSDVDCVEGLEGGGGAVARVDDLVALQQPTHLLRRHLALAEGG